VQLHLLDATYELFRAHFGRPPSDDPAGRPVGAVVGLVESVLGLLREPGVTHLGCATDHVIRSWRNERYAAYKTEAGMPPELLAQFSLAEEALRALGLVVWPMVEFEADDAIGTAAARFGGDATLQRVVILSPDKDMTQCVREDGRVVCFDRRRGLLIDADAVRAKFGVDPASIPDYLALVGDSSDGYPGLAGWGAKSAAAVLRRYGHLEAIPPRASQWDVAVRGAPALAQVLRDDQALAFLFRELARLRLDAPLPETLDELCWRGVPRPAFEVLVARLGARHLFGRVPRWAAG
jgi:5'-3' exonuclease